MYIYHIFFIHSSVDGHLGCFHVLAIINSAAMHIVVHVSDQSSYVEFLVVENTQGAIMSKVEKKKKTSAFYFIPDLTMERIQF